MNKKKSFIIALIVVLVVAVCVGAALFAIGRKNKNAGSDAETDYLVTEEYSQTNSTYSDGIMYVEFVSKDRSDFVLVESKMPESKADGFFDLDGFDDDYNEKCLEYLRKNGTVSVKSLADKIPDTKELEKYVGKTLGDLEADGFDQSSVGNDEDENIYFEYSNEKYAFKVSTVEKYEALFDLDGVDLSSLEIESITFFDFSNLDF